MAPWEKLMKPITFIKKAKPRAATIYIAEIKRVFTTAAVIRPILNLPALSAIDVGYRFELIKVVSMPSNKIQGSAMSTPLLVMTHKDSSYGIGLSSTQAPNTGLPSTSAQISSGWL